MIFRARTSPMVSSASADPASIRVDLPNGQRLRFGADSGRPEPVLKLNNYGVISKSLRRGGIGFAEAYIDGDFDCSDLTGSGRLSVSSGNHDSPFLVEQVRECFGAFQTGDSFTLRSIKGNVPRFYRR